MAWHDLRGAAPLAYPFVASREYMYDSATTNGPVLDAERMLLLYHSLFVSVSSLCHVQNLKRDGSKDIILS
jgi:hypothetical protein